VTAAGNEKVGMGDPRRTPLSGASGTDFFEKSFTNRIDATMLGRPSRPIAAKPRLRP